VVAGSGYGKCPSLLGSLEERGVSYVCGVESTFGVRPPCEVRAATEAGGRLPRRGRHFSTQPAK
jgi:hypothetical protein